MRNEYPVAGQAGLFCAMVCASLLTACGSEGEQAAPTPQVKKLETPIPVDPTAKMARAVTVGKSNVPVELKYEIAGKPIVGQPVEMEFAFVPKQGADSMGMAFVPSAGLTLSADGVPNLEVVKPGQPHHVKISAMADKADVFYVTVTATLYVAGTSSIRTFAIPLILSDPAAPAAEAAPAATPAAKS